MIEIIPTETDNLIGCKIDGKVKTEDIEKVANYIEDKFTKNKRLRIYVEVVKLEGISLEALFKDLKLGIKHFKDFDKKAVVTDKEWMKKVAAIADKIFPNIDVKCFSFEEKEKALEWAKE
ncbi:MAG: STAS/SEC14 domain-containing protein [Thermodesulfobacteriota bacterium]